MQLPLLRHLVAALQDHMHSALHLLCEVAFIHGVFRSGWHLPQGNGQLCTVHVLNEVKHIYIHM